MCDGAFNAFERISHQARHRFEQEKGFLLAWAHEAEHQENPAAIEGFRVAAEALEGAIQALAKLETLETHAHHEPTITRVC